MGELMLMSFYLDRVSHLLLSSVFEIIILLSPILILSEFSLNFLLESLPLVEGKICWRFLLYLVSSPLSLREGGLG